MQLAKSHIVEIYDTSLQNLGSDVEEMSPPTPSYFLSQTLSAGRRSSSTGSQSLYLSLFSNVTITFLNKKQPLLRLPHRVPVIPFVG